VVQGSFIENNLFLTLGNSYHDTISWPVMRCKVQGSFLENNLFLTFDNSYYDTISSIQYL